MTTTLDLSHLSRTSLRFLMACCAAHLPSDLPPEERLRVIAALGDGTVSQAQDAALSLATVQAWLALDDQKALRRWLEAYPKQKEDA